MSKELPAEYHELLTKYRDLLTAKIFEKTEQIKNEFRSFGKVNGLNINSVPEAIEAFDGEKIKIKLTFLTPQPDRAQAFLTIYFTSPKEFYLNISHTSEPVKEFYPGESVTGSDLKLMKETYEDLLMSDVYISSIDKDRLGVTSEEKRYSSFIDIIDELYKEPRKF